MGRHAQNYPKQHVFYFFTISKKEVSDEVDCLHADKDERYLQIDTIIFGGDDQAFLKFPK